MQGALKADRTARKMAGTTDSRTIWEEGTEHLKVSVWSTAGKEDLKRAGRGGRSGVEA